ncbi:hypothetical protein BDR26DRAFT_1010264 [Obelidium mucronatum]|nr:hypothetical protein BDR26DRAFT_1010264 [Obelidium mucronatum]
MESGQYHLAKRSSDNSINESIGSWSSRIQLKASTRAPVKLSGLAPMTQAPARTSSSYIFASKSLWFRGVDCFIQKGVLKIVPQATRNSQASLNASSSHTDLSESQNALTSESEWTRSMTTITGSHGSLTKTAVVKGSFFGRKTSGHRNSTGNVNGWIAEAQWSRMMTNKHPIAATKSNSAAALQSNNRFGLSNFWASFKKGFEEPDDDEDRTSRSIPGSRF